jgi:hypothetical protein
MGVIMIKMFWTMLLLSGVFTFSTIAAVVIKAMVSTEVSSEAEEKIDKICLLNMLLSWIFWFITIVLGIILLIIIIWK